MDIAAGNRHLMLLRDGVRVLFEYVESKAKWSDGTSWEAAWEQFRVWHGFFSYREMSCPTWPGSQQDCTAFESRSSRRLEQLWNWPAVKKQMHLTTNTNTRDSDGAHLQDWMH